MKLKTKYSETFPIISTPHYLPPPDLTHPSPLTPKLSLTKSVLLHNSITPTSTNHPNLTSILTPNLTRTLNDLFVSSSPLI